VKYFSAAALEELRRNAKWLARASDCVVHYWKSRNDKKAGTVRKFPLLPWACRSRRQGRQ
jgi:hypothetical protein